MPPIPAPPAELRRFLEEIEASAGPFAMWGVCQDIARAHAEVGISPRGICPTPSTTVLDVPSGLDYARHVTYDGMQRDHLGGFLPAMLFPPAGLYMLLRSREGKEEDLHTLRRSSKKGKRKISRWWQREQAKRRRKRLQKQFGEEKGGELSRQAEQQGTLGWGYPSSEAQRTAEGLHAMRIIGGGRRGSLEPRIGRMTLPEAQAMLTGLVARDMVEYRDGVPPVSLGLWSGQIVYDRADYDEKWQSARELWQSGRGDCEDLASAVSAERTLLGYPSLPVIVRSGRRTAHVVVRDNATGEYLDPSVTGGMGGPNDV